MVSDKIDPICGHVFTFSFISSSAVWKRGTDKWNFWKIMVAAAADNNLWSFWTAVMKPFYACFSVANTLCFCKLVLMTLKLFFFFSFFFKFPPLYIRDPEWTCLYRNCISMSVVEWSKSMYLEYFFLFTFLIIDESRELSGYLRATDFHLIVHIISMLSFHNRMPVPASH